MLHNRPDGHQDSNFRHRDQVIRLQRTIRLNGPLHRNLNAHELTPSRNPLGSCCLFYPRLVFAASGSHDANRIAVAHGSLDELLLGSAGRTEKVGNGQSHQLGANRRREGDRLQKTAHIA